MDAPESELEVVFSHAAAQDLEGIWDYNARTYGSAQHANNYVDFVRDAIDRLGSEAQLGRIVESNPDFRYLLIKRSAQGHGHIAVYRVTPVAVRIIRVLHTAQDWQNKFKA
jgi:plasmid stabilization system protein ParE